MNTTALPAVRFSEILVATDFSDLSQNAIELAKSIARRFKSEIVAVHVSAPESPISVPEGEWFYSDDQGYLDEKTMEQVREGLEEDGFTVRVMCAVGKISKEIVRSAQDCKADLVIAGTHAWTGSKRWLFGSVAEEVAHKLKVPMIIVGPNADKPETGESWHARRILCAVPMDSEGKEVALYTSALAKEMQAEWQMACDCVTQDPVCVDWETFEEDLEYSLADGDQRTASAKTLLLTKPYPEHLTELARLRSADLIVIGHSHQMMGWSLIHTSTLSGIDPADTPG